MRSIKAIYRTGKPRMSTVELDCGHKTEHRTADINKWQWYIGRTGMTCPTCANAEFWDHLPAALNKGREK